MGQVLLYSVCFGRLTYRSGFNVGRSFANDLLHTIIITTLIP